MNDPMRTAIMLTAIDDAERGSPPLTVKELEEKALAVPWKESSDRLAAAADLPASRVDELRDWLESWGIHVARAGEASGPGSIRGRVTRATLLEAGLGKASDTEVARRVGISRQRAQQVRRLLGIPSYTTALRRLA